ncbi:MAG: hypothetical protein Q8R55_05585 [Candidatus Taylorbacteria bacterium]|nr:hypothetical protein [Candidatus Taylorbacteria bacterium]
MTKYFKVTVFSLLIGAVAGSGYFIFYQKQPENSQLSASLPGPVESSKAKDEGSGYRTFVFDNFHGSTAISDKFQFQYPKNWYSNGQYFSPQKIQFYDLYSVKAPVYFDLILADIFNLTEFKYQIDNSKRRSPDTVGQIDGREFKKYDLIDYGTYGGESAGRVKIFVGPKIKIDGQGYFLVFHWEEKPLTEEIPGNNIDVFDNMLLTLKFLK